jgi:DnaK suppressor protein
MSIATKRAPKRRPGYERLLRSKQEELMDRLRDHRDEMVAERYPDDQFGLASRTLLENMTVDTLHREQQLLGEIEGALQRLEEGEYGVCEGCGAEITRRGQKSLGGACRPYPGPASALSAQNVARPTGRTNALRFG